MAIVYDMIGDKVEDSVFGMFFPQEQDEGVPDQLSFGITPVSFGGDPLTFEPQT